MTTPDDYHARRRTEALAYAHDEARKAMHAVISAISTEPDQHRSQRLAGIRDALAAVVNELRIIA